MVHLINISQMSPLEQVWHGRWGRSTFCERKKKVLKLDLKVCTMDIFNQQPYKSHFCINGIMAIWTIKYTSILALNSINTNYIIVLSIRFTQLVYEHPVHIAVHIVSVQYVHHQCVLCGLYLKYQTIPWKFSIVCQV